MWKGRWKRTRISSRVLCKHMNYEILSCDIQSHSQLSLHYLSLYMFFHVTYTDFMCTASLNLHT